MKRVVQSTVARNDLESIAAYSERVWGASAKKRYLALLLDAIRKLARQASMGRPRDNLGPGMRSISRGRHVIFYRETESTIEIVRVLHQRMNITAERLEPELDESGES